MKKAAVRFSMLVSGLQLGANATTMEECIAQLPADSAQVCEYANTSGDVCWMRNDATTGDLIFQCETKQWTALSCGSDLVSTCPQYDEAGQCLFVNCAGMTCRLTSPGRYGSKHLSCDRSNLDTETTTTTTTVAPQQDRRSQNVDGGNVGSNCENVVWAETRESCRNAVSSNNFGKCQYVVLPSSVANNNELTICVWQCCGDSNFAQCTTECETRLLSGDPDSGEQEGETTRRDMNNDELHPEDESVAPGRDNSQWGLSRGGGNRSAEGSMIVDGFAANQNKGKPRSHAESVSSLSVIESVSSGKNVENNDFVTDIAIHPPQSTKAELQRNNRI